MRCRISIVVACALALVTLHSPPLSAGENPVEGKLKGAPEGELDERLATAGTPSSFVRPTAGIGKALVLHDRKHRGSHGALEGRRWRRHRDRGEPVPESYVILKGGGLHVSEAPSTEGMFLGTEIGASLENVVDFGFTLDYFFRSSSETLVLSEGEANGLPVRAEVLLEESSVHLVPIGVAMRARLPLGERITPFISATLAYEILYLQNDGTLDPADPIQSIFEEDETFTGFGWQAAAGASVGLSSSFGLFGEVGLHRSTPKQGIELDGVPVDLKVDLDGAFLRGGLRVSL